MRIPWVQEILFAKNLYKDLHERGILSCTWNFNPEKAEKSKEIIEKLEKTKEILVIEGHGDAIVLEDEEIVLTDTEEYEGRGNGSSTFDDDDEKEAFEVHYEEEEIVM